MTDNNLKIYRKAARTHSVVCGFLFSVFSFIYLYVFQPYVMEALHFSLAHGKTHYAPMASAVTLTFLLQLLQVIVCRLLNLKGVLRAVAYFPSFLLLGILTDVGRGVYTSGSYTSWHWQLPLVLVFFVCVLLWLRHWLNDEQERLSLAAQLNVRLWLQLAFALMTVSIGNADEDFHAELEMEHYLREKDYHRALQAGSQSAVTSRTLTALRAFTLSHTGALGERLFEFPQPYGSKGLFFPSDSLAFLRFSNDSVYALVGAEPSGTQTPTDYLRMLCYQEKGKYTALDYYLSALLLEKRTEEFVKAVGDFYEVPDSLPRHYKEALAQYQYGHPQPAIALTDSVWLNRYTDYVQAGEEWQSGDERRKALRERFGTTYWWYYDFQ